MVLLLLSRGALVEEANIGRYVGDIIRCNFPDFRYCELLQEQRAKTVEELCHYAHENQVDLPADIARLVTSLVISRLEEEPVRRP